MPKDPIKTLQALEKKVDSRVAKILDACGFKIRKRVASQEFLHWRSRRVPVVMKKAVLVGSLIETAVRGASGWKWGQVHIGPPGSTTIRAKQGMLAIPTDFARKSGRGRPGAQQYGGTVIFAGIIWGKAGWGGAGTGGGLRQRRAAGEKFTKKTLIPLFILKKSVVVRRRIIPADLIAWIKPQFRAELQKNLLVP